MGKSERFKARYDAAKLEEVLVDVKSGAECLERSLQALDGEPSSPRAATSEWCSRVCGIGFESLDQAGQEWLPAVGPVLCQDMWPVARDPDVCCRSDQEALKL